MKQNREPRNKPTQCSQLMFNKTTQWGKIVSLINNVGKTGYLHAKEMTLYPYLIPQTKKQST